MSPLDQDALSGHNAHGMMGYVDQGAAMSRRAELGYEPELEGSSYQTAPITSLALARWTWAVAGLLIGALLGFLSATGGGFKAVSEVQISGSASPDEVKSLGQSLSTMLHSDDVLSLAVKALKATPEFVKAHGTINDEELKNELTGHADAAPVASTNLVEITVKDANPLVAIHEANKLALAITTKRRADADAEVLAIKTESLALINQQTLGPS